MADEKAAPPGIDVTTPSIARVYDYMLGGKDNFAIDREVADAASQLAPDAYESGMANRAFLRRVVRYLARERGVRQFLDLGSGLPTVGNVHEIAHSVDPECRVVYVDVDPIVIAHGRALLADNDTTTVIQADVRKPEEILRHPEVPRFLDFTRPVGLLFFAILHHINDHEDPDGIARTLIGALPPGSFVAISHFYNPGEAHPEAARNAAASEEIFNTNLGTGRWRTRDEIAGFLAGLEIVEPGLVALREWRPDPADPSPKQGMTYHQVLGGLARKP